MLSDLPIHAISAQKLQKNKWWLAFYLLLPRWCMSTGHRCTATPEWGFAKRADRKGLKACYVLILAPSASAC